MTTTKVRSAKLRAAFVAACALASSLTPLAPMSAQPASPPASAPIPSPAGRPNMILILADDLRVEGLSSYGGDYYTPNLDRLASEGVRFENAHATPPCSTSRTRIMTGQENHRNYEAFGHLAMCAGKPSRDPERPAVIAGCRV